jgi:hypothetical protein
MNAKKHKKGVGMLKLAKWILDKLPKVDLKVILDWLWETFVDEKEWVDYVCDRLAILAKKTENDMDDDFVEGLRQTLYQLFKIQ